MDYGEKRGKVRMRELPMGEQIDCVWLQNQLEDLPPGDVGSASALLAQLPEEARTHAAACAECRAAVQDFVDTRQVLAAMSENLPQAGPWFTTRVMRAIATQEREVEERQTGFWVYVRRLAPRLVALATLVLMLGGTWAFQERRAATRAQGGQIGPTEGIFEAVPTAAPNDDIIATAHEDKLP
jgi:hypothetical protein